MKIGILTYHRPHNYGGCLQAIATRVVLEQLGHEVYYVDYWPEYHQQSYDVFNLELFKAHSWYGKPKYLLDLLLRYKSIKKRQKNFKSFIAKYIEPYCRPLSEEYDAVIYGSDQIWRVQKSLGGYNPIYFANNDIRAKYHIAFSASMGILPATDKAREQVRQLLSHFNRIAVRETNLLDFVKKIGYSQAVQTIDPTLMLDSCSWDATVPVDPHGGQKYILVYILRPHYFDMDAIKEFAKREGLIVKVLKGNATKADTETLITTAGPEEFLSLVKNAEYVITSSFHGLAFSLIYHKQVYASCKENGDRLSSLLSKIGLPDHFITADSQTIEFKNQIDYAIVETRISALVNLSMSYLENIESNEN